MPEVMADWTGKMYYNHGAVHHLDVWRGITCIRVFLLADTLQVDIAFRPAPDFRATGPTFRLLFGEANDRPTAPPPDPAELIGLGWVYALHVRSSLERGRVWQAEYMLSHMREQVLALACLRHGLPTYEGRGIDDLPPDVTEPWLTSSRARWTLLNSSALSARPATGCSVKSPGPTVTSWNACVSRFARSPAD